MNDLLQLKGVFQQVKNTAGFGNPELPPKKSVDVAHLINLRNELKNIYDYWLIDKAINGALVSVYYIDVIAKSRRISSCFSNRRKDDPNDSIVGAKFTNDMPEKHIITHYMSTDTLLDTINLFQECIDVAINKFDGEVTSEDIKLINARKINIPDELRKNSLFVRLIIDAYFVNKFELDRETGDLSEQSIITLYKTSVSTEDLLKNIGIEVSDHRLIRGTTVLLNKNQIKVLKENVPYLISMAGPDLAKLSKENFNFIENEEFEIPHPISEPYVGVIDTFFDDKVYFSEWVKSENYLSKDFIPTEEDYFHGTAVTSIIVDGPNLNKRLDDGCGRFRVKHFAVATHDRFSSFSILLAIQNIVENHPEIKVWNLSLGAEFPINPNFISPEAEILDKIQYENDVIFVIAGTNNYDKNIKNKKIGAPADSINGIVVNSVNFNGVNTNYTREGPVLSFFNKPDVSYYGGESKDKITVMTNKGLAHIEGTSVAAPWITRKLAYLINVLGLSREVAKALIIDSAVGWNNKEFSSKLGHGVVPIRIEDVVKSQNSEIKFVISGTSEKYNTFNYRLPVPISQDKYPFIARATMCYFPSCSRNQGVDYTDSELEISFGRVDNEKLVTINNNYQSESNGPIYEIQARHHYRKWDNTKIVKEVLKDGCRPKKVYSTRLWGISIRSKERLTSIKGKKLNFGIVITLKEIFGVNRINDFIKQCSLNGWLVNRINIENQIEIFAKSEENIVFKD